MRAAAEAEPTWPKAFSLPKCRQSAGALPAPASQPRRFRPYHLSNYSRGNFTLKHSELPPNAGAQAALKNPPFLLPLPLCLRRLGDGYDGTVSP